MYLVLHHTTKDLNQQTYMEWINQHNLTPSVTHTQKVYTGPLSYHFHHTHYLRNLPQELPTLLPNMDLSHTLTQQEFTQIDF